MARIPDSVLFSLPSGDEPRAQVPQIKYEFKVQGTDEFLRGIERRRLYQPVQTPALAAAMAGVGPVGEWTWLDYLSAGDVARISWLRRIVGQADTANDVRMSAIAAMNEIRRVAEERMAAAAAPAAE